MSTRATIVLVNGWHLYRELTDDGWHVWLEFPKEALQSSSYGFALRIPSFAWAELRQGTRGEKYLKMPPEELEKEAREWVTKRLIRYNKETEPGLKSLIAFGGCGIADVEDPLDVQIAAYVKMFTPPPRPVFSYANDFS